MQNKIIIYQVLPRLFGNKNTTLIFNGTIEENGVGKFNDFGDKALTEIRDLGITHIWYTGVIEHAKLTNYEVFGITPDYPALVKGRAGSPYAIKDYYDVDPDLAENVNNRMQEFEDLVGRTHRNGMKVIIDFVPNHVFRQYKSDMKPDGVKDFGTGDNPQIAFHPYNNFYYLPGQAFEIPDGIEWLKEISGELPDTGYVEFPAKVTGNDKFAAKPDRNDWYETVKLNYGVDYQDGKRGHFDPVPNTWHKMRDILLFWAGKGVDGFRCDMAEMVPVEFWQWTVSKVREQFPKIIFIAEIYNPLEYHNYVKTGGFDFLYDKVGLYDSLKNILRNHGSTQSLSNCWRMLEGLDAHMLRFLENHDEVRLASKEFAGDAFAGIPALVIAATMNTGPLLIYSGQEIGEPAIGATGFSGDDGRTSIYDYTTIPEQQKWVNGGKFDGGKLSDEKKEVHGFYKKFLNLCLKLPAISEGKFYDLMWVNTYDVLPNRNKIFAYLRYTPDQKLLIVVDFSGQGSSILKIKIPEHAFIEMGFPDNSILEFSDLLWDTNPVQTSVSEVQQYGVPLPALDYGVGIFELKV